MQCIIVKYFFNIFTTVCKMKRCYFQSEFDCMKATYSFFYYKAILRKVSFDTTLFYKEYHKALTVLPPKEAKRLARWAAHYAQKQPQLLPVSL